MPREGGALVARALNGPGQKIKRALEEPQRPLAVQDVSYSEGRAEISLARSEADEKAGGLPRELD